MADITKSSTILMTNPNDATEALYPETLDSAVMTESGATVKEVLNTQNEKISEASTMVDEMKAQSQLVFDVTYSDGTTGRISVYGSQE